MVQNLNNNLITAPELSELRKRLRNLDSKVRSDSALLRATLTSRRRANCSSSPFFGRGVIMPFRHSHYVFLRRLTSKHIIFCKSCECLFLLSMPATDSTSAELEMTVNMLIQIDKLVQLLESPVFTCQFVPFLSGHILIPVDLRLQLLEPERYPYLYKCLYGVLMLLPQSSAFAALKNRLNSVSNIALLHTGPRL